VGGGSFASTRTDVAERTFQYGAGPARSAKSSLVMPFPGDQWAAASMNSASSSLAWEWHAARASSLPVGSLMPRVTFARPKIQGSNGCSSERRYSRTASSSKSPTTDDADSSRSRERASATRLLRTQRVPTTQRRSKPNRDRTRSRKQRQCTTAGRVSAPTLTLAVPVEDTRRSATRPRDGSRTTTTTSPAEAG